MPRLYPRFLEDQRGNFAVLTAFTSIFLIGAVGLTVDYFNLSNTRSQMQNAADTAALYAAREKGKSDSERKALARNMFEANLPGITPDSFEVTFPGNSVKVVTSANVTNFLGNFINANVSTVGVTSVAASGGLQSVEIAFVLDVSGSMNYGLSGAPDRLTALQTAVSELIDKLKAAASPTITIKAAIVPFTVAVNVGMNNTSFVSNRNNALFNGTKWRGCVFERQAPYTFTDAGSTGNWGAYIWPPMPDVWAAGDNVFRDTLSNGTMNGYALVNETDANLDPWQAGPNFNCTRYPILPLTADLEQVRSSVNSYEAYANMGTHIASGVSWGMRVLSPDAPFTEGAPYGTNSRKIMIVVTDGEQITNAEAPAYASAYDGNGMTNQSRNSRARWRFNPANFGLDGARINTGFGPVDTLGPYGFLRDSKPAGYVDSSAATDWEQHLDQLVMISNKACDEAKRTTAGRKIEVMTLGISTDTRPGTRIYDALERCASQPEDHFYVSTMGDLRAAFDKILSASGTVRLTQ